MLYLFAVLPFGLFSWLHRRERGAAAGFGWIIPVAMGAASLIGKLFKNKGKQKQQQQEYDAQKAQWENETLPQLQAQAAQKRRRNNLRASLARAYGLDKVMPGAYEFQTEDEKIANPFDSMQRPKGFDWTGAIGDAAETAGSTLASGVGSGAGEGGQSFWSFGSKKKPAVGPWSA